MLLLEDEEEELDDSEDDEEELEDELEEDEDELDDLAAPSSARTVSAGASITIMSLSPAVLLAHKTSVVKLPICSLISYLVPA